MKLRYEKNIRIMNDLLGYCHYLGAHTFQMDLDMQPAVSHITVRADVSHIAPGEVESLSRLLNLPRQREVEQNYWNISGEEEIDTELTLAAVMIDSAEVSYAGGELTISVHRIHQSREE